MLRALLRRWPTTPKVDLITTDGFLFPNAVLEARGLMERKGFPESYDCRRWCGSCADLKAGKPGGAAPVYSHLAYDIVPGGGSRRAARHPDRRGAERAPDVAAPATGGRAPFVSDFFDFSIYVDADEAAIRHWYLNVFAASRHGVPRP